MVTGALHCLFQRHERAIFAHFDVFMFDPAQLCNVGAWTVMASAATRMGIMEIAAHQLMLSLWLVIAFVQGERRCGFLTASLTATLESCSGRSVTGLGFFVTLGQDALGIAHTRGCPSIIDTKGVLRAKH